MQIIDTDTLKPKILLLDTSTLFYRSAYSTYEDVKMFNDLTPFYEYLEEAIERIKFEVGGIIGVSCVISVMDANAKLLREQIYPPYKQNRRDYQTEEKIFIHQHKTEFAMHISNKFQIPNIMKNGYESDDILHTLAKHLKDDYDVWIYTVDKDLLQLVEKDVSVILWGKDGYTKVTANDNSFLQEKFLVENYKDIYTHLVYVGDVSDNIKGVAGVGKVTASKLIKEFGDCDSIFRNASLIEDMNIRNAKKISLNIQSSYDIIKLNKLLVKLMDVPAIDRSFINSLL
jgi:DNA-directed DNA polymerase